MREVDPRSLGEEWDVLWPDFLAYEARHRARPRVFALDRADAHVIRYPQLPPESLPPGTYLYRAPQQMARAPLSDHLASLGFFVDDDGVVRTVPTPRSFDRLMSAAGLANRGYRAELVRTVSASMPTAEWLELVISGKFPINVASPVFHVLSQISSLLPFKALSRFRVETADIGLLVHDLGVHVLATHLLPADDVHAIGDRIRRAGRLEARALDRVGTFFEGDLTRYCQTLWRRARSPEEFDAAHQERRADIFVQLEACLSGAPSVHAAG